MHLKKGFVSVWGRSDQWGLAFDRAITSDPIVGITPAVFLESR